MSTTWLTYTCPNKDCGDVELEAEIEPADNSYGADADGNRGTYVPAYVNTPDTPAVCPECKLAYTTGQMADIMKQLEKAAEDYEPADDYPEDYGEDREY